MQNHEPFDVEKLLLIKASAGSGKTHRLTGEYLRLLFSAENQYKHILAVTFTNKATDEMKTRIVEELNTLAIGEKSDYDEKLKAEFELTETQIKSRAKNLLENILHDYSSFSISTIDKFFQQTMRAFTREMGLSGGYKIELDQKAVLNQIVDLMILELDLPQNKDLAKWILDYMRDQIEKGRGWNIKDNIVGLANQLFNEKYKLLSSSNKEKIENKEQLKNYGDIILKIVRDWENEASNIGKRALNIMSSYGVDISDIKYGKGSGFLLFTKWANKNYNDLPSGRFINCADNVDNLVAPKSNRGAELIQAFDAGLNDCVKSAITLSSDMLHYNTAKSILRNFFTLGILNDVSNRLRAFQKDNNTLFLSDTTELLNVIIADSDAPFIYEKTGTRIVNFMIDEFQDTSSMQWRNFKPLISESLANANFNLIVGDVKQSIYRWRNSDWGLLEHEIPKDFGPDSISTEVLDTNWRSDANIVNFNNSVFHYAARLLQLDFNTFLKDESANNSKIVDAYKNVFQLLPKSKQDDKGHVKISFLESDDDSTWQEKALDRLPHELESLQDQGFSLKDIAILVRTNKEAIMVAEYLLKYKENNQDSKYRYDIISNEALVIGNAQSVRAAVALIRYFNNRNDNAKRMIAVYEYNRFHRNLSPDRAILDYFEVSSEDFPENIKEKIEEISSLPFYDMIEAFFSMHSEVFEEKENVYVQAFLDIVLKFSTESSSNARDFLEWWDDNGHKKALFTPDNQDAIRLMTIHKSKGLGFNAVVMPFLGWDIDHSGGKGPVLWCKPEIAPFSMMDAVPLVYSSSLNDTIFSNEYLEEKLYTYIDNLNLLYVAFTRAKNSIVVFAPKGKPLKENFKDVSSLLWYTFEMARNDDMLLLLNNYFDNEKGVFEIGTASNIIKKEGEKLENTFSALTWQSIPFDDRLKLRLSSIGFFSDDGSREYGTMMHEIISGVQTIDDIDNAVDKRYLAGEIERNKKEEIKQYLKTILSSEKIYNWYSGKYQVLNEMQILHPKHGFSRPDRVMIGENEVIVVDYKFGELEDNKYIKQVKHYVRLISEMGYKNVSGFVFYVNKGSVYKV